MKEIASLETHAPEPRCRLRMILGTGHIEILDPSLYLISCLKENSEFSNIEIATMVSSRLLHCTYVTCTCISSFFITHHVTLFPSLVVTNFLYFYD